MRLSELYSLKTSLCGDPTPAPPGEDGAGVSAKAVGPAGSPADEECSEQGGWVRAALIPSVVAFSPAPRGVTWGLCWGTRQVPERWVQSACSP